MNYIINSEQTKYTSLKEKFSIFFKILKKNNSLNIKKVENLSMKLSILNNNIDTLMYNIDSILYELKDGYCDIDKNIINEIQENQKVDKLINELKPFFLLYQLYSQEEVPLGPGIPCGPLIPE